MMPAFGGPVPVGFPADRSQPVKGPRSMRIRQGLRRAFPLCCQLICLGIMGTLHAEENRLLRAVDIRLFCQARPDLGSAKLERIRPGERIWVVRQAQVGPTTWYAEGGSPNGSPRCWVYGPGTVELDQARPGPGWLALLDHILAREDMAFEEYVEVDNALQEAGDWLTQDRKAIDDSGLIQFRRLQMIERMLAKDDAGRDAVNGSPLKKAWILGHSELIEYSEPGGRWWLRKAPYRALLERYKSEPFAEEIAWALTTAEPGDECDSNCMLEQIANGPLWYLLRYPAGAHAPAAMQQAMDAARQAADMACSGELPPEYRDRLKDGTIQKIRDALARITLPGTQEISRSLDGAVRKCRMPR